MVALETTHLQNTYSITIVVKGIIKLYKAVKHKKELYCKVFAFLILYDYKSVGIYGHSAIIKKEKTIFYYYSIHDFSFTAKESKHK